MACALALARLYWLSNLHAHLQTTDLSQSAHLAHQLGNLPYIYPGSSPTLLQIVAST